LTAALDQAYALLETRSSCLGLDGQSNADYGSMVGASIITLPKVMYERLEFIAITRKSNSFFSDDVALVRQAPLMHSDQSCMHDRTPQSALHGSLLRWYILARQIAALAALRPMPHVWGSA
jgi:hypothetical protein